MITSIYNQVLGLLFNSVIAEGGDGDALWLSKYESLDKLALYITEYSERNNIKWDVTIKENYIYWGTDQELVTITDDVDYFNQSPDWITLKLNF